MVRICCDIDCFFFSSNIFPDQIPYPLELPLPQRFKSLISDSEGDDTSEDIEVDPDDAAINSEGFFFSSFSIGSQFIGFSKK